MYNREIEAALNALTAIAKKQLPMTVAIKMAECRRKLEGRARDFEGTRNAAIARQKEYIDEGLVKTKEMSPDHPNFTELRKEIDELLSSEFDAPDTFHLYVRTNDAGDEEFCWTKEFKTAKFVQFDGEIVYGMMPILHVNYDTDIDTDKEN